MTTTRDEIERLVRELYCLPTPQRKDALMSAIERVLAERDARIAAQAKTVEALREDAERLKFLCSRMFAVELSPDGHHKWIFRNKPLEGANVQAAIDAARSEERKPK